MIYRFVDCRWELGNPARGRELYLAGHVPGASFLDLETELSAPPSTPGGRHPLPAEEDFARAAGAAGIGPGVFVVAYDQGMNGGAARLWWLLRHFGHDDVAVLDGGIGAWLGPLRGRRGGGRARHVHADGRRATRWRPRSWRRVSASPAHGRGCAAARALPGRGGADRPGGGADPRRRERSLSGAAPARSADAEEIVAYCGSGVTASVTLLRLAQAGRPDAKLYPGSWSDWCGRGLPAERG